MSMTPEQAAMWQSFAAQNNMIGPPTDIVAMGDTPQLQDALAALIASGTKRATCALARWYGDDGEELPAVGDYWLVIDGQGRPVAIVRVSEISIKPVADIDAHFAWDEGEGDRSHAWWKAEHTRFWEGEADREGFVYSDTMDAVCIRFALVTTSQEAGTGT
jgi:uncharacterized protein YhfF